MRHAIEAKIALLGILRDPRCKWRETRGNPEGGWGISIYEGTSAEEREKLERKYNELT